VSKFRKIRRALLGLFAVALFGAIGFGAWVLWMLSREADDAGHEPYFTRDPNLSIEKTTSDGVKYTVNNSLAVFGLDVVGTDDHSAKLFPDYAAALKYCASSDLPVIPSVQMIHGKCKQFNDDLCATLELAIQTGIAAGNVAGKRQALTQLAEQLVKALETLPPDRRSPVEKAATHVVAALRVGGRDFTVSPELTARVNAAKEAYLDSPMASKPIGFWQQSEELRNLFVQDRFLVQGLRLKEDPGAVVALATVISRDPELAQEFKRFRDFDAKLTNPPRHVRQGEALSPSSACPSFADIAAFLPSDAPLVDLLEPGRVKQLQAHLMKKFGEDAGFALVSYSQSKEYDLLLQLAGTGGFTGAGLTLELITDAVQRGALSLEPKPDSGWYDYQWYALETLLLPEKARESPKLVLTDAYKKRLKAAFKSMLTKDRETHIKHLPVITMGMSMDEEEPVKVEIGPEFSAEPTATVYLRTARGYRFISTALAAVLGEGSLKSLSRPGAGNLADELTQMALLLYGIYDHVSSELGQTPVYLDDEISPDEITKAKDLAKQWLAEVSADPDLSRDTRVAVPIFHYPGGPVRYWATGGIRLERVKYRYINEPDVDGVEAIFVPTFYYLLTDISLEFEKPSASPLTRAEFRQICDSCQDEVSLRRLLGARSDSDQRATWSVVVSCVIAVLIVACLILLRRKLSRALIRKVIRLALAAVAVLLVVGILVLVFCPSYRLKVIVRHVASRNIGLGLFVQMRLFYPYYYDQEPPAYMIRSLADLLSDDNAQVRYLAMTYLHSISMESPKDPETVGAVRDIEDALRTAADDPVSEVANGALMLLGNYSNDRNLDLLRSKLKSHKSNELVCMGALIGLADIGDAGALEEVLPYTKDPRRLVRRIAISQLGRYTNERATRRIAELLQSSDELSSRAALSAVRAHNDKDRADAEFSKVIDPILLAAARTVSFSAEHREGLADNIPGVASRILAYEDLLLHPSAGKYETAEDCQIHGANKLAELRLEATSAIPTLQKVLEDPNTKGKVRRAITDALKRIGEKE